MATNNQPVKVEAFTEDARSAVFTALRAVLRIYQDDDSVVKADKPDHCGLETRSPSLNGRRLFFAAAKMKKNYVSYYLPALYMFPELANRMSPELRRRLQDNPVLTSPRWLRTALPSWKN